MRLKELIDKMINESNSRSLSDEFLQETGRGRTRKEIGIGEFSYGIVMVPVDWVIPYLEELYKIKGDIEL
jgi:hypothetical protein